MTDTSEKEVDLSALDRQQQAQDTGIVVEMTNADGKTPLGFGIRVCGPHSEQGQLAASAMQQEIMDFGTAEISERQKYEVGTRFLARRCIAFTNRAVLDGKILESKYEDFLRLLVRFRWMRAAVDGATARSASFLPASSAASSTESERPSQDESGDLPSHQPEPGGPSGQ